MFFHPAAYQCKRKSLSTETTDRESIDKFHGFLLCILPTFTVNGPPQICEPTLDAVQTRTPGAGGIGETQFVKWVLAAAFSSVSIVIRAVHGDRDRHNRLRT
jgi:hypothetical protein